MAGVHREMRREEARNRGPSMLRRVQRARDTAAMMLVVYVVFNGPSTTHSAPSKAAAAPKPLLGRPGTNLKAGLVGLPNVGKSSLFNVLCSMAVPAENYPFCTIDPAHSRVAVPDERFEWLCELYSPSSKVPAHLAVTDIAGLVKGAAEGLGLGNAFLSHIAGVDCLVHVVRLFEDPDIAHVEDSVDPVRDLEIISAELRQKDLECVRRRQAAIDKAGAAGKRKPGSAEEREAVTLAKAVGLLEGGKGVSEGEWSAQDIEVLNTEQLLTAKGAVYVLNLSEADYKRKKSKWLPKVKAWVEAHGGGAVVPISCVLEARLAAGEGAEEREAGSSGLQKLIKSAYSALGMESFFTVGADEVRAWSVRRGSKAPEAAGEIHSDMQRGFIMAETIAYADLKEHGSVAGVKAAGKYKMNGREYLVQDGDIFHFKFNVAAGGKAAKK